MLLNESLTRVHSQKDPRLHFGESYALTTVVYDCMDREAANELQLSELRPCFSMYALQLGQFVV